MIAAPGEHGGDAEAVARSLGIDPAGVLDLSMSLNPVAPDPTAIIAGHLDSIRRYPDASVATVQLAATMGVDRDRLLLTNGGAEAIALVAGQLRTGWVIEPEFSLYARHLPGGGLAHPPLADHLGRVRSNPNNPTGALAAPDEQAAVWDEAFYPLATGSWTRGDSQNGAWVVGSLTKLLACPGLRLGYVLAPDPDACRRIAELQPRWALAGIACAALGDLLATVDLPRWSAEVAALRSSLVDLLAHHDIAVRPSEANFVLADAPGLRARLAPAGVVVRDCASFGLHGWSRIAVPAPAGLDRLAQALGSTA